MVKSGVKDHSPNLNPLQEYISYNVDHFRKYTECCRLDIKVLAKNILVMIWYRLLFILFVPTFCVFEDVSSTQ